MVQSQEFVIHSDHESLKHLKVQGMLMRNVVPTNKNKRIQRAWRVNTIDS